LAAGAGPDLYQGFRKVAASPIGPIRGEGIEAVSQGQDLAQKRNLLPGQASGITAAVPPFVMMQDEVLFLCPEP
jgi:hypothetical protein